MFLKKSYFCLITLLCFSFCAAQAVSTDTLKNASVGNKGTDIPAGPVTGTFLKASSPYRIKGSIIIPSGEALIIEPGTVILMDGEYTTITVFGQIVAKGTKENPIIFKSGKSDPKPWDWDRILFRSRARSFLQYCIIQNSNYGAYVVNTSLTLFNCTFSRNSIHGLYAKNSSVSMQNCLFEKGHVAAIMLDVGGELEAEQTIIRENINGVLCGDFSTIKMINDTIENNSIGMALKKDAGASLTDTKITANKIGIVAEEKFPKKNMKNINENQLDLSVVNKSDIERIFKKPAEVSFLAFSKKEEADTSKKSEFKAGFISQRAPREAFVQIVGNATLGFKYYKPFFDGDSGNQNRYIEGLQPEMQLFTTGRKYGWDVNLLMDTYRNNWLSGTNPGGVKFNLLNLKMNNENNGITLGDFFQNGSDLSVSSRKMYGLKYESQFMEMGRGDKRFNLTVAGGETERSLIIGDHNPDVPNDTIASGFAIRQQMLGMGRLSAIVIPGLTVGANAIHSRDLDQSIIRKNLTTSDLTSNKPLQSTMGSVDAEYRFYNDKLVARIEGAAGYADSLDDNFVVKERPSDFSYTDAAAASFGLGAELGKVIADMQFTTVRPKYYSGGNPYLTPDQHEGKIGVSTQFSEKLSGGIDYNLTIRNASYTIASNQSTSPIQSRGSVNGKYAFGKDLPELNFNYTIYTEMYDKYDVVTLNVTDTTAEVDETTGDTSFTVRTSHDTSGEYGASIIKNTFGIGIKEPLSFLKSSNVRVDYRIQSDKDKTSYLDPSTFGERDALQHTISGILSTRHLNKIANRFTAKYKIKNETKNNRKTDGYEINDRINFDPIPRKLKLALEGKYRNDFDIEDAINASGETERPTITSKSQSAVLELKYVISNKISANLTGNYEKNYDETEGSMDNYHVYYSGLNFTYVF